MRHKTLSVISGVVLAGLLGSLEPASAADPAKKFKPTITASPAKAILNKDGSSTKGSTTLTYDGGPDHPYVEVWVSVDGKDPTKVLEAKGNGEIRAYVSGQIYPFDKATVLFGFDSRRPRLLGDRPVVIQFWKINGVAKDVKLGEKQIVCTEKPGEHVITFSGSDDGDFYKYQVKYRLDPPK